MSFTEPAYALPIVLDGTETITVDMTTGASDFVATLTAGTYYNYNVADDGSNLAFAAMVVTQLNAADTGTPWAVSTPSTGLSFRLEFVRTGTTPDEMTSVTFSSDVVRCAMGFSALAVTAGTELANDDPTTDDTTWTGSFQRGYLWAPRVILGFDERLPIAEVAGSITAAGRAVVDGYGEYERIRHTIEFVPGPLVYTDKAADADFQGVQVDGLALADDCAPLDQFWTLCRTGADGAPPVIKYLADATALTSTEDIVIASLDWLADMENVAEKTNDAPLYYRVVIDAIESVGTSFVSTGATQGAAGEAITTASLYSGLADGTSNGDWGEVTGANGGAGAYRWLESMSGTDVKAWIPGEFYNRIVTGGWVVNGSGDHQSWLTANGNGPNTAAALPTLGWVKTTGPTLINDVGGDTRLGAGVATMDFTTVWPVDGQIFFMIQASQIVGTSSWAGLFDFDEATLDRRLSLLTDHTLLNRLWGWNSGGARAGIGDFTANPFDMVFGVLQMGTPATYDTSLDRIWAADVGWTQTDGAHQPSQGNTTSGGVNAARFITAVAGATMDVRRWQAFIMGQ